jgi:release factor glutamine methyltransferase
MTLTSKDLLLEARDALRKKGIESATLDAELICCHAMGFSRTELWAYPESIASAEAVEKCRDMVKRRTGREPIAYIIGEKEFWSLEFKVTPSVFIPRPETETLVEAVLEHLPVDVTGTLVEVGTGSGCVAVALAMERKGLYVVSTDVSTAALSIARENVHRHGLADRVFFVACDVAQAISSFLPVLGLVSNPPYVADPYYDRVSEEVRYEPPEALDGGPSGLDFVGRLIEQAEAVLEPGAFLAMEVGPEQVADVGTILADGPWDHIEFFDDLQGVPRVLIGDRAEE